MNVSKKFSLLPILLALILSSCGGGGVGGDADLNVVRTVFAVGEVIEGNDATNEQCALCSDVEDEAKDEIAALCGNGGPERAAKPGNAAPVNYPFWEIKPVAPGEPTATEACDRPVHETNPDDVQGDKRVTESGGHETDSIDMNWEDG